MRLSHEKLFLTQLNLGGSAFICASKRNGDTCISDYGHGSRYLFRSHPIGAIYGRSPDTHLLRLRRLKGTWGIDRLGINSVGRCRYPFFNPYLLEGDVLPRTPFGYHYRRSDSLVKPTLVGPPPVSESIHLKRHLSPTDCFFVVLPSKPHYAIKFMSPSLFCNPSPFYSLPTLPFLLSLFAGNTMTKYI